MSNIQPTPQGEQDNIPKARDLLKKWLSVSESQICSLEVLCSQVPEVQTLLETNMTEISESFVNTASNFEMYTEAVKQVIYVSDELGYNHTTMSLENALKDVRSTIKSEDNTLALEKIDNLIASTQEHHAAMIKASETIDGLADDITQNMGQVIIGMQFQDRVSQNLVIVTNVLNAIIKYLQDEIDVTISNLDRRNERAELDQTFARSLLAFLTLGELQHKFVDHLVTHGYIQDPSDIGYDPGTSEQQDTGEIDLF